MTKTKQQLRAEAVERLKENSDWAWSDLADFFKASGLMDDPYHTPYGELRSALIDLLTDDCDTECYECARLAELMAENSQLRVRVDGMTRIDQDERLPRLADAETRVRELQDKVDELTEQLESAHAKNRSLKAHIAKMQEGRHGWHVKYPELEKKNAELQEKADRLARENVALARDLGECMAERDGLRRENSKLSDDELHWHTETDGLIDEVNYYQRILREFKALLDGVAS